MHIPFVVPGLSRFAHAGAFVQRVAMDGANVQPTTAFPHPTASATVSALCVI
jgi:hypothetical protein